MRLFVALDIPDAVRDSLNRLTAELRPLCAHARWVRIAGAHVTLKFIGEVADAQAQRISDALRAVPREPETFAPFELTFSGLGFFPEGRRPRVFWAGIHGGAALAALASSVEEVLLPFGVPRESRSFQPHVTLARLEPGAEIAALRAAVAARDAPQFGRETVRELTLYRSVLQRSGAEYTRLATYPLSGDPVS